MLEQLLKTKPSKEWIKCPPQSNGQIGDLFVVFKIPFNCETQVDSEHRFTPKMILDSYKIQGARINLWIDTTKNYNFYSRKEIVENSTHYISLPCNEEDEEPTLEILTKFIDLCNSFSCTRKSNEYIGIHCSLGFNLSGYFICSFLIEQKNYSLEQALAEFSKCRPNGIYNKILLNSLYRKYYKMNVYEQKYLNTILMKPQEPKWLEFENRNKNYHHEEAKFVDGILGIQVVQNDKKLIELQIKVQELCQWKRGGFPGRTAVTMNFGNVNLLKSKQYFVSLKADGRRYLLFIQKKDEIYFIDRENQFYQVNYKFEFPGETHHLMDTLIDGTRVYIYCNLNLKKQTEIIFDTKTKQPLFLMFDIISFCGQNLMNLIFEERYHFLMNILKIRNDVISKIQISQEIIHLKIQTFTSLHKIKQLLIKKDDQLNFDTDGLFFSCVTEPYHCGSCDLTLKWKPNELTTVDFLLKFDENYKLNSRGKLYVKGLDCSLGEIIIDENLKNLNGKIIECFYENLNWKFLRHRSERIDPNSYNTAMEVIANILEPIDEKWLFDFIQQNNLDVHVPHVDDIKLT